jgi:hypothetical protein
MYKMSYNGFTNYATWRVHNDITSMINWEDDDITSELLEEIIKSTVFDNSGADDLVLDYAMTFLNDVNYYELVELYKSENNGTI